MGAVIFFKPEFFPPFTSVPPASAQKTEVNIAVPTMSMVTLPSGRILRGVVFVDELNQKVTVKVGDKEETISFAFSERPNIRPDKNAPVYNSKGMVIRGDKSNITPVIDSFEVGWQDFSTTNKELGQVQVMLPNQKYEGIISVARDSQYVVEEIVFDPQQQKMTIRVRAE